MAAFQRDLGEYVRAEQNSPRVPIPTRTTRLPRRTHPFGQDTNPVLAIDAIVRGACHASQPCVLVSFKVIEEKETLHRILHDLKFHKLRGDIFVSSDRLHGRFLCVNMLACLYPKLHSFENEHVPCSRLECVLCCRAPDSHRDADKE